MLLHRSIFYVIFAGLGGALGYILSHYQNMHAPYYASICGIGVGLCYGRFLNQYFSKNITLFSVEEANPSFAGARIENESTL